MISHESDERFYMSTCLAHTVPEAVGRVPFPLPRRAEACEECEGTGTTGRTRHVPVQLVLPGAPAPHGFLILDVTDVCQTCGGCGDGDHRRCLDYEHADADAVGVEDDPADPGPGCERCSGRGWDPSTVDGAVWRIPCTCAESRAVAVSPY